VSKESSSKNRMPIAIWALAAGAFGIGTTEFVVMGLLQEVARDFGISISTAGYIVTAYALGVVIGAPFTISHRVNARPMAITHRICRCSEPLAWATWSKATATR